MIFIANNGLSHNEGQKILQMIGVKGAKYYLIQ